MAAPRKITAAPETSTESPVLDVEELLSGEVETEASVVELTPAQKRIRELEAELLAEDAREETNPTDGLGRPKPAAQLTEEQRAIRDLEDRLAKRRANNITTAFEEASSGDTVHIHFTRDGFTAGGHVWYRGQEIVYDRQGDAYKLTIDKLGNSWVDLAGDTSGQYERFGDEYFRAGPFIPRRGEVFQDAVAVEDSRRGTAAPITRL